MIGSNVNISVSCRGTRQSCQNLLESSPDDSNLDSGNLLAKINTRREVGMGNDTVPLRFSITNNPKIIFVINIESNNVVLQIFNLLYIITDNNKPVCHSAANKCISVPFTHITFDKFRICFVENNLQCMLKNPEQ